MLADPFKAVFIVTVMKNQGLVPAARPCFPHSPSPALLLITHAKRQQKKIVFLPKIKFFFFVLSEFSDKPINIKNVLSGIQQVTLKVKYSENKALNT